MLGAPITLLSLVTSTDALAESVSEEDFSLLPAVPEPELANPVRLERERQPSLHLLVLATSVFHPPQA
jgi:hypothetical protein